jgi:AcrR family transcriptional regulator
MSRLREQIRSPKARPYRMRRRAEKVDETRQRIIEAAIRLHTTIGASHASISAVAEEAGVTRLTLYRHFSSQDELFAACRGHWRSQHPPPDRALWRGITDFDDRLRTALRELYGWYRQNADDLTPIYRDVPVMPESVKSAMRGENEGLVSLLVDGTGYSGVRARRLRAAIGHVIGFPTWRSLAVDQGLSDGDCVDLSLGLVKAAVALSAYQGGRNPQAAGSAVARE